MTKPVGIALLIGAWFVVAVLAGLTIHFIRIYLPPVPVVYEIRYVVCRVTAGEPDCETIKQERLDEKAE